MEETILVLYFFSILLSLIFSYIYYSFIRRILDLQKTQKIVLNNFIYMRVIMTILFYGLLTIPGVIIDFSVFMIICILRPKKILRRLLLFEQESKIKIDEDEFLRCSKCNHVISKYNKLCPNCGHKTKTKNIIGFCMNCGNPVGIDEELCPNCHIKSSETFVYAKNINPFKNKSSEKKLLKYYLNKKIIGLKGTLPNKLHTKRLYLNTLLVAYLFIFMISIFFHLNEYFYLFNAIIILLLAFFSKKTSLSNYLLKEINSRSNENVIDAIKSIESTLVKDTSKYIFTIGIILSIIIPLIYFREPRIFYKLTNDNSGYLVSTYTLGLTNNEKAIIPSIYNGKPVIGIETRAFRNLYNLKEVRLPNSIKEINSYAFANDESLKKINIPVELKYLGKGTFMNCKNLKTIELNDKIKTIEKKTFYNCQNLRSINIPDTVTKIKREAFKNCNNLSTVYISRASKLNEIENNVFENCEELKELYIPVNTKINEVELIKSEIKVNRYYNGE